MSTKELRKRALEQMRSLSRDRLKVAVEFLAYLEERASDEATEELLRIPGAARQIKSAARTTRTADAKPWRKVRRDV